MGNRDDSAAKAVQELLQPVNGFSIQVVSRFVEQEHVGARQQEAAERHTATFTTGEDGHVCIPRRQAQCIGCNFQRVLQVVRIPRLDDVFALGLLFGEFIKVGIGFGVGGVDGIQLCQRIYRFAHTVLHVAQHVFGWV